MIEWLKETVQFLVAHPDQVVVSEKAGVQVVVVSVTLAPDDFAQFAGKNNRLTRALNAVLSLAGVRERKRYVFKVTG
jgi:predicted RNA-binding protein YlqC (UPF0109 family)